MAASPPSNPRATRRGSTARPIAARPLATAVLAALLAGAGGFRSQDTQPAPAEDRPAAVANSVVVTSVEGKARARADADAEWQIIKVGLQLPQGAEIQTGPTGRVVCSVPPGREFVVDRMSKVTVLEAAQAGNSLKTDLLMEYGRTDLRVQKAGLEQDARIRTPGATASVRGTELSVYNQPPFAPELRTYTGVVDYRFAKRQLTVAKGGRSSGGRGAAETALLASVVDPAAANARTNADAALIANEVSRGAVLTYDPDIQLNEIRGGAGPQTDTALVNSLPGRLNFVIRWDQNVDVDLFVTVQPGDQLENISTGTFNPQTFLYPGFGLQTSPTGGQIPYNHRGGPNGGQEICFWPDKFPTAIYGFSALSNSSTDSVDVRFNAFLDGEKISLYTFAPDGTLVRTKGVRRTLPPEGTAANIVLAPPNVLFEEILPESPDETTGDRSAQGGQGATQSAAKPVSAKDRAKANRAARAASKASAQAAAKAAAKAAKSQKAAKKMRPIAPAPAGAVAASARVSARGR